MRDATEGTPMMTPGQRCDEIIRLIEETLGGGLPPLPAPVPAATTRAPAPAGARSGRR